MLSSFYRIKNNNGGSIYLVPFNREFMQEYNSNYLRWFNDSSVTKYNSHGLFPYTEKKKNEYLNSLDDATDRIIMAIVFMDGNKKTHIGNVSLQSIDWINRSAEFAIIIGEPSCHGAGIGAAACRCMLIHGFDKMNLNRIWTGTAETNEAMNALAVSCGFKYEGCFRQGMYLDGEYVNINTYAILRNEWRQYEK